jgi:hypothetical protein
MRYTDIGELRRSTGVETMTTSQTDRIELLFTRGGRPITAGIRCDDKGKPFVMEPRACGRCGGQGGAEQWKHTGWTCFDCGGSGKHKNGPAKIKLYTEAQIAKLNASASKRATKRQAKADARAATQRAEADQRRDVFNQINAKFFELCEPYIERNSFVQEIVNKARERCTLSDKQEATVLGIIANIQTADRNRAASDFIGKPGERLRNLAVTVERVKEFEGERFGRPTMFRIVTMRGPEGQTIVVKSGSFYAEINEKLTISGTVREHSTYRDEKQTRLERVKIQ